jgi:hypothetical protein
MVASRRIVVVLAAAATAAAAGCSSATSPVSTTATRTAARPAAATAATKAETSWATASNCPPGPGLGKVAFAGRDSLRELNLDSCRIATLVHHRVAGPVRWSADGGYIGYARGAVIAARGGRPGHPLGKLMAWSWAPTGHLMAGVTGTMRSPGGGLVVGGPGQTPEPILPDGWGARDVVYAPSGDLLAVARAAGHQARDGFHGHQQIWSVDPATGVRRRIWSRGAMESSGPQLARFSPGSQAVLFWTEFSASIDADGRPLEAVPVAGGDATKITTALLYRDYVADCGREVVVAAGGWRESTAHKRLIEAAPPTWNARSLTDSRRRSWTSPSCSASGTLIAAAAGPGSGNRFVRFGQERRSIWVLPTRGGTRTRLTFAADRNTTDESPRMSADGRTILFVRTTTPRHGQPRGKLLALSATDEAWREPRLSGPIVRLGHSGNYYGHYGWAAVTDWYQPAG